MLSALAFVGNITIDIIKRMNCPIVCDTNTISKKWDEDVLRHRSFKSKKPTVLDYNILICKKDMPILNKQTLPEMPKPYNFNYSWFSFINMTTEQEINIASRNLIRKFWHFCGLLIRPIVESFHSSSVNEKKSFSENLKLVQLLEVLKNFLTF